MSIGNSAQTRSRYQRMRLMKKTSEIVMMSSMTLKRTQELMALDPILNLVGTVTILIKMGLVMTWDIQLIRRMQGETQGEECQDQVQEIRVSKKINLLRGVEEEIALSILDRELYLRKVKLEI